MSPPLSLSLSLSLSLDLRVSRETPNSRASLRRDEMGGAAGAHAAAMDSSSFDMSSLGSRTRSVLVSSGKMLTRSKWRCGPPVYPVLPLHAICCPAFTRWPTRRRGRRRDRSTRALKREREKGRERERERERVTRALSRIIERESVRRVGCAPSLRVTPPLRR